MTAQGTEQLKHLENAFQAFNQMSEQLMSSYHQLEGQVERLNRELAAAHGERLEQYEQKQQLANRLERLLDALPAGVVVLDGRGGVRETNSAAVELLGEPLEGIPWRSVIQRVFKPCADDGHDVSLHDGRRVSISTSTLGEEPGQIILITDVTEKRHLQDKLARFQRLSAMGQMAASLAHQVRTPTASALLYLSNLRRHQADTESFNKYCDKVRRQLQHIENMVGDMLVYARGGSDAHDTEFTTGQLIDSLLQSVQGQVEQMGYGLEINNRAAAVQIKGNREALHGALVNLVMNSIHAAGREPLRISLNVGTHARQVLISIADNGTGIPEGIKEKVFDPFVTSRPQGTGLGLAVVKSVVEKHGGEISLESREGGGTKVTIVLPVFDGPQGRQASQKEREKEV